MAALVVNLFGGPGTGKSTTMAGTFAKLKLDGVNCEMAPEYAKDLVWQESLKVLENQIYVFGKQYHRLFRLLNQVDVVITDSPILLSVYYNNKRSVALDELVHECHDNMNTLNIMLYRKKEYNPKGRYQTEEEAKQIDMDLEDMLIDSSISFFYIDADAEAPERIAELIYARLEE